MQPTPYPYVNDLLATLLSQMQAILGGKLVGLYLSGSLVIGDFDGDVSDIDLLAAISSDLNEADFAALQAMHDGLAAANPAWKDRIEVAYLSLHGLKTFRTERSPIGIISPGEPFHIIEAGEDWVVNWYIVRAHGQTLFGPPPAAIIDPISMAEFMQTVKDHIFMWRDWIADTYGRGSQAYAILTLCRGLYTLKHGEQVSKRQAALWAKTELPQWAALIDNALLWRQAQWNQEGVDHAATLPETRRFVEYVVDLVASR
jgi:hypothetical protein